MVTLGSVRGQVEKTLNAVANVRRTGAGQPEIAKMGRKYLGRENLQEDDE